MGMGECIYFFLSFLSFSYPEQGVCESAKGKKKLKLVLAASYLNYLLTNNTILMPKYYKKGRSLRFQGAKEIGGRERKGVRERGAGARVERGCLGLGVCLSFFPHPTFLLPIAHSQNRDGYRGEGGHSKSIPKP